LLASLSLSLSLYLALSLSGSLAVGGRVVWRRDDWQIGTWQRKKTKNQGSRFRSCAKLNCVVFAVIDRML
jgi:hypothetical protein